MMDFVKSLLTDFDPAKIFPDLEKLFSGLELLLRISVLSYLHIQGKSIRNHYLFL